MEKFIDNFERNFSSDIVETLWDSENYFFSKYYIDNNGIISMLKANSTYLEIKNYNQKNIGMNIRDFKSDDDIPTITKIFEMSRKNISNICFLTEYIYGGKYTLWKIYVKIDFPVVKCIGEIVKDFDEYIFSRHNTSDCLMKTIIVTDKNGRFCVDMFSDGMENLFPDINVGCCIDEISKESTFTAKLSSVLEMCRTQNGIIRYFDIMNCCNGKCQNMYIVTTPFHHNNSDSILINFSAIKCDFWSNIYSATPTEVDNNGAAHITGFSFFGTCVLDCNDKENPLIMERNEFFSSLLKHNEINIKSIVASPLFKRVLKNEVPASDLIVHKKDGIRYTYSINIIPQIKNDTLRYILVIVVPTEKTEIINENIFKNLTPREAETIDLVIKGYTNKYIAYTLHISEGTVKKTLYNSYHKLGVQSRVDIIKMKYEDRQK